MVESRETPLHTLPYLVTLDPSLPSHVVDVERKALIKNYEEARSGLVGVIRMVDEEAKMIKQAFLRLNSLPLLDEHSRWPQDDTQATSWSLVAVKVLVVSSYFSADRHLEKDKLEG